jgi:hypothetical protein
MRKTKKVEPTKTYEQIAVDWNVSVVTAKRRMKQHRAKAGRFGTFGAKEFPLSEVQRVDKEHKLAEAKRLAQFAEAA